MHYPKCPRCDNLWIKSSSGYFYQCSICDLDYYIDTQEEMFGIFHLIIKNDMLVWNVVNQYCEYITNYTKVIKLPWLDPKITIEQLKLYLVFI